VGSGAGGSDAGIRIWGDYDDHVITDNTISYCFTGIIFNQGADNTTVRGNVFKNNDKVSVYGGIDRDRHRVVRS
jgi:parallel beta-helix repeat protein